MVDTTLPHLGNLKARDNVDGSYTLVVRQAADTVALLSNVAGAIADGGHFLVPAGSYTVRAIGTFAGNTVKPQMLDIDLTTWVDIPKDDGSGNIAFTSPGSYSIDVTSDTYMRGVVSGVGTSSGVYLAVS